MRLVSEYRKAMQKREEREGRFNAMRKAIRQAIADGTYKRPEFKDDGGLSIAQQNAIWNAFLMDLPEWQALPPDKR